MALDRYGDTTCDSCNAYFDGDPIEIIEVNTNLRPELQHFWLCGECKEFYPRGAEDFFTPEFLNGEDEEDDQDDYDYNH